jgi:hypothetical protein
VREPLAEAAQDGEDVGMEGPAPELPLGERQWRRQASRRASKVAMISDGVVWTTFASAIAAATGLLSMPTLSIPSSRAA